MTAHTTSGTSERREFVEPPFAAALAQELGRPWAVGVLQFVRNFHNLVYRASGASPTYLRITPALHRSREQLLSELRVVQHVAGCGVRVARPIPSTSGELIHTVAREGGEWHACLFEEAPGAAFDELGATPADDFFRRAGEQMGQLHGALDRLERPAGFRRFSWLDDRWSRFAQLVPSSEVEAWRAYDELCSWSAGLPRSAPEFGLIHGDFTIANLRIAPGAITLFDFDACCEHWRAYELAVFLHYFGVGSVERRRTVYRETLSGYASACGLSPELEAQIAPFGKARLLYSFLVFAEEWGFQDLGEQQRAYFEHRRRLFAQPPTWSVLLGSRDQSVAKQ